jgi:hypothetical protein
MNHYQEKWHTDLYNHITHASTKGLVFIAGASRSMKTSLFSGLGGSLLLLDSALLYPTWGHIVAAMSKSEASTIIVNLDNLGDSLRRGSTLDMIEYLSSQSNKRKLIVVFRNNCGLK